MNCFITKTIDLGSMQLRFNGSLWLARDKWYSTQYLGSGKTQQEAIDNMAKTVKEYNLKTRDTPYFEN